MSYVTLDTAATFVGGALSSAAGQYAATSDHTVDLDQVWASALGMGIGSVAATLLSGMDIGASLEKMLRAAAQNVGSQAGGLLAGTQDRFSWAGVATAAIMVPISSKLDKFFGVPETYTAKVGESTVHLSVSQNGMPFSMDLLFRRIGSEMVKGYGSEYLTVFLAKDGKVNAEQVVASAFGTAVGNSIVDQMKYNKTEEWVEAANDAWAESEFAKWDQDRSLIESDSRAREAFNAWDEQMAGLPWRTGVGAGGMGAPFNPSALIGPVNQMQPLPETTPELWASPAPGIFDRFGEVADDPNLPPIEKLRRYGQLISVPSQFEARYLGSE